jgi:hypothetical protein
MLQVLASRTWKVRDGQARAHRPNTDVAKQLKEQAVARIASALLDGDLAALLQRSAATTKARD